MIVDILTFRRMELDNRVLVIPKQFFDLAH
jgi:hypothetical protein